MKTLKLKEDEFCLILNRTEIEQINEILWYANTFIDEKVIRKSPISVSNEVYDNAKQVSNWAFKLKDDMFALNKLMAGFYLDGEITGEYRKNERYIKSLIKKLSELTNDEKQTEA